MARSRSRCQGAQTHGGICIEERGLEHEALAALRTCITHYDVHASRGAANTSLPLLLRAQRPLQEAGLLAAGTATSHTSSRCSSRWRIKPKLSPAIGSCAFSLAARRCWLSRFLRRLASCRRASTAASLLTYLRCAAPLTCLRSPRSRLRSFSRSFCCAAEAADR